jgi:hypothetical protein
MEVSTMQAVENGADLKTMQSMQELQEFVRLLYEFGCPVTQGYNGVQRCYWCESDVESGHNPDCLWIQIEEWCNPMAPTEE